MQGSRQQPGVTPRAVEVCGWFWGTFQNLMSIEALFEYRQTCKDDASLSVSYMEIYKDEVFDLLVDRESVGHVFAVFGARRWLNW
jgi:kinesin family member 22